MIAEDRKIVQSLLGRTRPDPIGEPYARRGSELAMPDGAATARRQGIAKITSNDSGGAYKITEVFWNPSTSQYDAVSSGIINAAAREVSNNDTIEVDDIVTFRQQLQVSGQIELVIDAASGAGTHVSPKVMLPATAIEGTEAAYTDSWDITSQGENDGVTLYTERVGYYDSGNETLYGYARLLTFDSAGRLVSIDQEQRIVIDSPTGCVGD